MSEWITDRRPTKADAYKDAESVLYECVIVPGRDYKLYRKWYNVDSGEAWQCIELLREKYKQSQGDAQP